MDRTDSQPVGYIYGPVPSRRLGLSLGVDIVPAKICTLDCVYCQLGRTTDRSVVRGDFVDIRAVIAELEAKLAGGVRPDYITIGGSGEPTLNVRLGELIDGIRRITDVPIVIITNGTLLHRPEVRAECIKADVIMPSLDAADTAVFEAVNRPAPDISIEKLISGLIELRRAFSGQIWLEVFLIEGVNTGRDQIQKLREAIQRIGPDRVQLNSAVRPAAEDGVEAIGRERLEAIAQEIGGVCEVVGAAPEGDAQGRTQRVCADVLSMLKRRPCSLEDICKGLGMRPVVAAKYISDLLEKGAIVSEHRGPILYYRAFYD